MIRKTLGSMVLYELVHVCGKYRKEHGISCQTDGTCPIHCLCLRIGKPYDTCFYVKDSVLDKEVKIND